jgi:membrane protease YdiL (CAAX protease family)
LIYLGAQLGAGMFIAIMIIAINFTTEPESSQDEARWAVLAQGAIRQAMIPSLVVGGVAAFMGARLLLREELYDLSPTGAAWKVGTPKNIAQGFAAGVIVASCVSLLMILVIPPKSHTVGPLTRMAITPGLPQWLWLTMALLLAPPIEELLFRGVLYGGYRKSLGPLWAAILTTSIFILLHITEFIYFLPSALGILVLACAALWLRLRCAAIGPAVACHFGYNAVVALRVLYLTLH